MTVNSITTSKTNVTETDIKKHCITKIQSYLSSMFFEKCHHSNLGNAFVYLGKRATRVSIELDKAME